MGAEATERKPFLDWYATGVEPALDRLLMAGPKASIENWLERAFRAGVEHGLSFCPRCEGKGRLFDEIPPDQVCPDCKGTGKAT